MPSEKVDDLTGVLATMDRYIPKHARLIMLDLVLAWARVDTTIAQLATAQFNMDPTVGAVIFGRMPVPDRLNKMRELNLQLERAESAKALRKLKKQYEEHSKTRNTIAHAACVGFLSKPDRIVFLPFESEGKFGNLAVDVVPTLVMLKATNFAKQLDKGALAMVEQELRRADKEENPFP